MTHEETKEPELSCLKVYAEFKEFYQSIEHHIANDLGYEILYGPPRKGDILMIGYQPGYAIPRAERKSAGLEDRWNAVSEFVEKDYRLDRNLRAMFGSEFVKRLLGLNAVFVQAKSVKEYRRCVSDKAVRREIESVCRKLVGEIIHAVEPPLIVVNGLDTFQVLGGSPSEEGPRSGGRRMWVKGVVVGVPAIGVMHLSGAQIARIDRARIAQEVVSMSDALSPPNS
jgi:hypothetical protein